MDFAVKEQIQRPVSEQEDLSDWNHNAGSFWEIEAENTDVLGVEIGTSILTDAPHTRVDSGSRILISSSEGET